MGDKRASFPLKKKIGGKLLLYICMLMVVAFTMLPLVYVVSTALKPIDELFLFPPRFFVQKPTLDNFRELFEVLDGSSVPFSRYFFNSLFVTAVTVTATVIVCSMAAYALEKKKLIFANAIFSVVIASLMFSTHVTQIPTYFIINHLGLMDTFAALILPKVAVAYNMFLLKQFMSSVPDTLLEAARIDGARDLQVFSKIVLPAIKPAIVTLIVLSFVSSWNDYFSPLIFITEDAMKTLPLALQLIGQSGAIARAGAMTAATLITIVPTITLYLLMQNKVVQTMTYSGIKG